MAAAKRRLPVLQQPADEPDEPRPPWQWVGFGALGIFVVWVPVAWVTAALILRLGGLEESPVFRALLFGASAALASFAGGFLVGRWGTRGVGVREAGLSGLAAGVGGVALTWVSTGSVSGAEGGAVPAVATLATAVLVAVPAAVGGKVGLRFRR